jgi:hypothetical protein
MRAMLPKPRRASIGPSETGCCASSAPSTGARADAWDCVIPGLGGKDSFYAAHMLKHKYGMHPLLCTWAPHMPTDWGWRNLQRWQAVGDHIMVTPNRSTHRLVTRLSVENLFHPFLGFVVGQKSIAAKIALQYDIPLVFYGESRASTAIPRRTLKVRSAPSPITPTWTSCTLAAFRRGS